METPHIHVSARIRDILQRTRLLIWFVRESNINGKHGDCDQYAAMIQQNLDILLILAAALLEEPIRQLDLPTMYPILPPHTTIDDMFPRPHGIPPPATPIPGPIQASSSSNYKPFGPPVPQYRAPFYETDPIMTVLPLNTQTQPPDSRVSNEVDSVATQMLRNSKSNGKAESKGERDPRCARM